MINEKSMKSWYVPIEILTLRRWLIVAVIANILLLTIDVLRDDFKTNKLNKGGYFLRQIEDSEFSIIATGSEVVSLPGVKIDEKNIISSTGALSLSKVPKKLAVIGGGYIGLEMGSVWSRLGSEVTVIEYLDHITPGMDREISDEFKKILTKQ